MLRHRHATLIDDEGPKPIRFLGARNSFACDPEIRRRALSTAQSFIARPVAIRTAFRSLRGVSDVA